MKNELYTLHIHVKEMRKFDEEDFEAKRTRIVTELCIIEPREI